MYAYDNLAAGGPLQLTAEDYGLRDQMTTYWLNFVATGDPNGAGVPEWPAFSSTPDRVMGFDGGSRVMPRPQPQQVDFWMNWDGPIA